MPERIMIAYCGLVCTSCEGYLATQANDNAWKERLAEKARSDYGVADATIDTVTCEGCKSAIRRGGYCNICEIRACGDSHQVENCAACAEFAECPKIQKFMEMVPEVRETFASLH